MTLLETPVESVPALTWRSHLLQREPGRLPILLLAFCVGALCVWLLFGRLLPVLAAVLLLVNATGEYLFPQRFRLNETGVYADAPTSCLALRWEDVRRCLPQRRGILLSPLPVASRLDAFRGIYLRFAPDGEPGDRASVLAVIAHYAPSCLETEAHARI